ncbi:hypothetical protein DY000_02052317 [Brassica cretica]|uniref:Uncharacterized protein n=1 Tax=Brassica cretica TaxID=69181 RepID=A0ABQ7A6D9_BRACR|nr:hypothetical protein DY000_02052317 [Brassica cretica]
MVEEIYRTLGTTEDRLDRICDEIYFPWDITINASKYRPTITEEHRSTKPPTNRGELVTKVKSDMSDTNNHGEEILADPYATLVRHQFKLECLGDKLQKIENTTATMKDKWRRGD